MTDTLSTPEMLERIQRIRREKLKTQEVVPLDAFRPTGTSLQRKTILVIDDEPIMRSVLVRIFEKEGFDVLAIADALELEDYLGKYQPAMILLDINLPWVDGYELCRLFKRHDDLRHVPIVFVSGNQSEEQVRRGFEAGCDDYIRKPFCVDELKDTVFTLLRLSQS